MQLIPQLSLLLVFGIIGGFRSSALFRYYKDSLAYAWIRELRLYAQACTWRGKRTAAKVPRLIKERTVRHYASRFSPAVFIETGTFRGDMLFACKDMFTRLESIELDESLHAAAVHRFSSNPRIRIHHGDSADILPHLIAELHEPALFWLDAHYSGGITARGSIDTPIVRELDLILSHDVLDHVVLIDDAHEFIGSNGYPTLDALETRLTSQRPDLALEVWNNIIRIHRR